MQPWVPFPRQARRTRLHAACLAALLAAGCGRTEGFFPQAEFARPETTVTYEVELSGAPSEEIAGLAEASLASWRFREEGVASLAFLRRRAESDVPLLMKILHSLGYYSASVEVEVEETAPGEARVGFAIEPGPAYTLARHEFVVAREGAVAPPELDAARLGSPVGRQARAAAIAEAETAAVALLKRRGFAYAAFAGRSGLADPETATLEVESRIAAGRAYSFGTLGLEGVESVEEDYLSSYLPWKVGERFDAEKLRTYQQRLFATELFDAVAVRLPETPPEGEALPLTVVADERPPRTIGGGLRYDTDLGPSARASFEHRNLFGRNERFLAQAEGGLVEQLVGFAVRKPQFLRPGQELTGELTFKRTDDDAFKALSVTTFGGLERELSRRWHGGLGGLVEASEIDDDSDKGTALLLGIPGFAAYDGSDDLLDPTKGARLRLDATPFAGVFDGEAVEFLVLDARGSVYRRLDEERRFVLAARGRAASILAPDLDSIPATRRLYSGGGGSVRGYEERFIGPLDDGDDPVGGRSALEAGLELRAGLVGDFGGVVFAEAGSVSTNMLPDFEEGVQVAAGLGLRYYTVAGPVRLDVAFPLNPRDADDAFQVYFSIGQAF